MGVENTILFSRNFKIEQFTNVLSHKTFRSYDMFIPELPISEDCSVQIAFLGDCGVVVVCLSSVNI